MWWLQTVRSSSLRSENVSLRYILRAAARGPSSDTCRQLSPEAPTNSAKSQRAPRAAHWREGGGGGEWSEETLGRQK